MTFTALLTVVRSALFQIILYTWVSIVLIACLPTLLFGQLYAFCIFRFLTKNAVFLMKHILRIHIVFEHTTILQETLRNHGPFIIACKHQSGFETVAFSLLLKDFTIVSKEELRKVPLIGWYMQRMNFIFINRKNGKQALSTLFEKGKEAIDHLRPILIFPEGSRSIFGQSGHYHAGVALLYKHLNVPIVPVSLNIGSVWQRKSVVKYPGTATIRVLPPILPGLEPTEALHQLEQVIENSCKELGNGRRS